MKNNGNNNNIRQGSQKVIESIVTSIILGLITTFIAWEDGSSSKYFGLMPGDMLMDGTLKKAETNPIIPCYSAKCLLLREAANPPTIEIRTFIKLTKPGETVTFHKWTTTVAQFTSRRVSQRCQLGRRTGPQSLRLPSGGKTATTLHITFRWWDYDRTSALLARSDWDV